MVLLPLGAATVGVVGFSVELWLVGTGLASFAAAIC